MIDAKQLQWIKPRPDEIQVPGPTEYLGYPGRTLTTPYIARLARYCVAGVFGMDAMLLRNPARGSRQVALGMQLCVHLTHIVAGRRHEDVADWFERNRSTASHNFEVMENLRDVPDFDLFLHTLETSFENLLRYAEARPGELWGDALTAMAKAVKAGKLEADAHYDAKFVVESFLTKARRGRRR